MGLYVIYCKAHMSSVEGPYTTEYEAIGMAHGATTEARATGQECFFDVMELNLMDGWTLTKRGD